jgi:hypothetical protein
VQLKHSIRSTFVVLLGASALAASASAGGEPKNQWPFTRPVGDRTTQAAASSSSVQEPVIQGEPKNEPPFTRPATVIVQSSGGFSWTDAGIGLMAGIGIAASGVGLITLARKSPLTA